MKNLFSWLLRVGVLIALAAIAWVIYVNFQQQSGQPVEEHAASPQQQPVDETAESTTAAVDAPQTPPPAEETATTETPAPEERQAPQPPVTAEPATPSVAVQLPTTEPATETETTPAVAAETEQASTPTQSATPGQSVTETAVTETAPSAGAETAQPAAAVETDAQATTTASSGEAEAKPSSLQEARMAAWKGQWDKAESVYLKLQQESPEDYNIHGELGNLYYMQRKGKEAAEAYYQAATLLAAQGYQRDAMRLTQVIQRLDRDLGIKLQQELFGSGNAPTPSNSP